MKNEKKILELAKELKSHVEDYIEWKQEESLYSISALTNRIVHLAKEALFPEQKEAEDEQKQ
jgi:hypothetical protein